MSFNIKRHIDTRVIFRCDDRQGKAPATTGASVSASIIAAYQSADGSWCSDGLVLPSDWGGDVYSSKELQDLTFSRTFLVQLDDNLEVAARLLDLLRGHVQIMGLVILPSYRSLNH